MTKWNLLFHIGALISPSLSGKFSPVPIITEFHNIINTHPAVSIIVIIGLPNGSKTVYSYLPVISKIPSNRLEIGTVLITTKNHPLLIGPAIIFYFVASLIDDWFSLFVLNLPAAVAKVEIELTIRTKVYGMDTMIVLNA